MSTYDLILINKHILGLAPFGDPYTQIAADANKSRSITTFDIIELRKLILGVYTEFPNNTSWRFVPKDFVFPNPNNPFQTVFPTSVNLGINTTFPIEFLGIKVGDVNCNAIAHSFSQAPEERNTSALALPDADLTAGQILETPLYHPAAADWQGLQFALEFDPGKIELVQVVPGDLPGLNADAFAQPQPGLLTLSWFEVQAQALAAGTPLLQLHWRAKKPLHLSEAVRLQPKQLRPEAYTAEGREQGLELLFGNPIEENPAVIFAPQPNPTAGASVLPVQILVDQLVILELFDLNGRLVFQNQLELPAGMHRLELPAEALARAGVYVWRVQLGDLVRAGKLVRF